MAGMASQSGSGHDAGRRTTLDHGRGLDDHPIDIEGSAARLHHEQPSGDAALDELPSGIPVRLGVEVELPSWCVMPVQNCVSAGGIVS